MTEKYDAIVIGAGNSGLTSALALAQSGAKTLLLEKQGKPGGYATTFRRGNYIFEGSLHHLSGLGNKDNPGPLYHTFEQMGIIGKVKYLDIPAIRVISGPYDMSLPTGKDNFKKAVEGYFPEEKDGIEKFFKMAWECWHEFQEIFHYNFDLYDVYSKLDTDATPEKYPIFFKYAFRNGMSVLKEYFKSPYLMYAFSATSMYSGPLDKISFLDMLIWPINYFSYPQSHILGGSQAQSIAIADQFKANGGELKLGQKVKKILVKQGQVQGVETVNGDKYYADKVITNISPIVTYGEMMDKKDVPAHVLDEYNGLPDAESFVMVYLGLDCPSTKLGVDHAIDWIVDPLHPEKMPLFIATRDPIKPHDIDAQTSASQTDATTSASQKPINENSPHYGKIDIATVSNPQEWLDTPPELYAQKKYERAEQMLTEAEKYFPGIRKHIVTMNIATSMTNARFSGAPAGSIGGLFGDFKNHLLYPQNYDNKVKGLYLENTGVVTHNGFQSTLSHGYAVGKHVAKVIKENK